MITKTNVKADRYVAEKVFILKKSVILGLTGIIAAIIAAVFLFGVFSIDKPVDNINVFYMPHENGAIVVKGENAAKELIKGKGVADIKYSLSGESATVVMSDGASYSLYYTDGSKVNHITSEASANYVISADGSTVAYCDSQSELYVYNCATSQSTRIDNDVQAFALSPSGKVIIYSGEDESVVSLYVYSEGNASLLGENYIPLGVSDDLSMIYVLSADNSLYVLDKNGDITSKICSEVSADKFCFSADMKNIVFNDGQYTYASSDGKSRVRLVSAVATPVNTADFNSDSNNNSAVCSNVYNTFYSTTDEDGVISLCYVSENSVNTVSFNVKKFVVTGQDSAVYLDTQGKVYRYSSGQNILVQSGVLDVFATSDGSYIYYKTSNAELFCLKKGESVRVAEGVSQVYITSDGKMFFIDNNGGLFSVKGAKVMKQIDENVHACICNSSTVMYMKNYSAHTGTFGLYVAKDSLKFSLVAENVSNII